MMRRMLAVAALLGVAACAPGSGGVAGVDVPNNDLDVATPELVQSKADLGIEPCPQAQTADGGLPEITLRCFGGGRDVDLSTLEGPTILNFWQAYCGPCREEMPALQEFHERYADQVQIIGVDYADTQVVGAMQLAGRTGATYPMLADPIAELADTGIGFMGGLPYFVFLRADGSYSKTVGGVQDLADLVELAEEQLGLQL
ncbi:MAG: TlpA family protein disulfide reductase [Nocardioides sp.]